MSANLNHELPSGRAARTAMPLLPVERTPIHLRMVAAAQIDGMSFIPP